MGRKEGVRRKEGGEGRRVEKEGGGRRKVGVRRKEDGEGRRG